MKNLKKYLSVNSVFILVVMMMGLMVTTACSKDDEPGSSKNSLEGSWYFTYNGETDYDDYFLFRSNGTGLYHYDYEQSDDFTYTYDPKTNLLILNYKHWDSETIFVEWLGNNAAEFGSYGKYVRR